MTPMQNSNGARRTSPVTIRPATLRDASWVTANMRPMDRAEVFCQLAEDTKTSALAYALTLADDTFCAFYRDQPAALFGVGAINICTLSVWAIGTKHMPRVTPAITRCFINEIMPRKMEQGFTSAEARSLVGHHSAHRWMTSIGGKVLGEPFLFGRGGEMFRLFRWTIDDFDAISRGKSVHQSTQGAAA